MMSSWLKRAAPYLLKAASISSTRSQSRVGIFFFLFLFCFLETMLLQTRSSVPVSHSCAQHALKSSRRVHQQVPCPASDAGVVVAFSSHARIWGEFSTNHSSPAVFFKVEIRSRTLNPLLRPASDHSGSARGVYACLGVTCHLHFWQNDRGLLRATAVTRGWNEHRIRVGTQLDFLFTRTL